MGSEVGSERFARGPAKISMVLITFNYFIYLNLKMASVFASERKRFYLAQNAAFHSFSWQFFTSIFARGYLQTPPLCASKLQKCSKYRISVYVWQFLQVFRLYHFHPLSSLSIGTHAQFGFFALTTNSTSMLYDLDLWWNLLFQLCRAR